MNDKPKKTRKNKKNENNIYLKEYETLDEAEKDIEHLENYFDGATLLEYGNKQPISKRFLFSMLRDLDNINTESVQAYCGLSEAYCSRLAQYLRVLSNSVDRLVEGSSNGGIEISYKRR